VIRYLDPDGQFRTEEIVGMTEVRRDLARVVDRLTTGLLDRAVFLRWNRPVGVLLSVEEYERLRRRAES